MPLSEVTFRRRYFLFDEKVEIFSKVNIQKIDCIRTYIRL